MPLYHTSKKTALSAFNPPAGNPGTLCMTRIIDDRLRGKCLIDTIEMWEQHQLCDSSRRPISLSN